MVKIIFNIIIIILYNKGENTTRTLQRHSNEQPARRSNTSWWKHLDRYAPSQISSFAWYAPDFVQMQRLHLDNLLAKKRFVRVCYDAGMSASVRNKEKHDECKSRLHNMLPTIMLIIIILSHKTTSTNSKKHQQCTNNNSLII